MSYTALYRKWRPDNFSDVKGQDHIVTTIKNQIIADRIGHAYLFCGTRGTGKTTIAKIFAKAVNCENPVDGSPCGECASCKAIASGSSMNVIEIDAASNNGVDTAREIKEEVQYSPTEGKYKVYIIDEVHMLTKEAFNALLKTIEEPPSYVIFLLATTEAHKIPVTILSRCQRYDFKRISVETISDRLNELMQAEGIEAEENAVKYIAKAADGGMRDALSLLDQCVSFYFGQKLTYDKVLELLGALDTEFFSELLRKIVFNDVSGAFRMLETAVFNGRDLSQLVIDFTWYLRNLLLVKTTEEDITDIIDISSENYERLKEEADFLPQDAIMRYIRIFSELSNDIKYATQKRVMIEMAIIKLCKPSMETDTESMLERIRQLELKLENGTFVTGNSVHNDGAEEEKYERPEKAPELPKALSDDIKKAVSVWPVAVVAKLPGMLKAVFAGAKLTAREDDKLLIVVSNLHAENRAKREDCIEMLTNLLDGAVGAHVEFEITHLQSNQRFSDYYKDLSQINFEIEYED